MQMANPLGIQVRYGFDNVLITLLVGIILKTIASIGWVSWSHFGGFNHSGIPIEG